VLESEGFVVREARDGREALDALHAGFRPRLILLDLMMPVMNGSEFVHALGLSGLRTRFPIIVMSADTQTASKTAGLGLDTYLKKPVDLDDLLELVAKVSANNKDALACER
jgi:CheY-like chemotaxis protein